MHRCKGAVSSETRHTAGPCLVSKLSSVSHASCICPSQRCVNCNRNRRKHGLFVHGERKTCAMRSAILHYLTFPPIRFNGVEIGTRLLEAHDLCKRACQTCMHMNKCVSLRRTCNCVLRASCPPLHPSSFLCPFRLPGRPTCGSPFSASWGTTFGRTTSTGCWGHPTPSRPGGSTM